MTTREGILFAYFDLKWLDGVAELRLKKAQMVKGRLRTMIITDVKNGDLLFEVQDKQTKMLSQAQLKISKMHPITQDQTIGFDIKIPWTKPSEKLIVYQQEGSLKKIKEYDLHTILEAN